MSYSSLELDRENGSGSVTTPVAPRRRPSSTTMNSDSDVSTTTQHELLKEYVYKKVSVSTGIFGVFFCSVGIIVFIVLWSCRGFILWHLTQDLQVLGFRIRSTGCVWKLWVSVQPTLLWSTSRRDGYLVTSKRTAILTILYVQNPYWNVVLLSLYGDPIKNTLPYMSYWSGENQL